MHAHRSGSGQEHREAHRVDDATPGGAGHVDRLPAIHLPRRNRMAQSTSGTTDAGAEPWPTPTPSGVVPISPPKPGFGSSEFYLSLIWAIVMAAVAMHIIPENDV